MTTQPIDNRIFVFGSNLAGRHGAGAALFARKQRGAIYGQARGLQGQSYAIPTLNARFQQRLLDDIMVDVGVFLEFALAHPELHFQVTPIGTGLAGFDHAEIALLFRGAPANCDMPSEWADLLNDPPPMFVDEKATRLAAISLARHAKIEDADEVMLLAFERSILDVVLRTRLEAAQWIEPESAREKFLALAKTLFGREVAAIRERQVGAATAANALAKSVYWRRGSSWDSANGASASEPPE